MNDEIAVQKPCYNQIAVRHGLPPVGAMMVNQHGIEWRVDGHLQLRTLATIARSGMPHDDSEDPQDLYPVIIPQNLSPRLTEFIAETSRCTSKSIMPVDTMPSLRPQSAHPESYWVDGRVALTALLSTSMRPMCMKPSSPMRSLTSGLIWSRTAKTTASLKTLLIRPECFSGRIFNPLCWTGKLTKCCAKRASICASLTGMSRRR